MDTQIKFYQTGTFTVGNRLLAPEQRSVQASIERSNSLNSGHRACQGCGEALGARYAVDAAMRATQGQLIAANATGCLEVFSTPYPETSWQLPWIHSLFGNAAAVGTGIAAALKVKAAQRGLAQSPVRVIAQGGDGGTTDIGFGCLSGMFERNDDVLYICYDNEAYMNTGVQRSSATPPAARTATTMAVGEHPGADFGKGKNLPRIAMAHEIPYVATATVADLHDLEAKVEHAMNLRGARYLHILVPCPLGWGSASHDTIKLARLARETGIFPVFEAERGEVTRVTKIRHRVPVDEYLRPQKRFAHLFGQPGHPEMLAQIQADADRNIRRFKLLDKRGLDGQALRDHARPRFVAGQQDRQLAHRAPGLRRPAAAVQRPVPGGRRHPGLAVPRRRRRLRSGVAPSDARQPVPGHHGARLLSHVRDGVQPRPSRRRRRHQLGGALSR